MVWSRLVGALGGGACGYRNRLDRVELFLSVRLDRAESEEVHHEGLILDRDHGTQRINIEFQSLSQSRSRAELKRPNRSFFNLAEVSL